jgi:hypothetical protein
MKRLIAAVLAAVFAFTLTISAGAVTASFPDVAGEDLMRDVAVLQMMGAVGGDENGNFVPGGVLTRAAFCKIAVIVMGRGNEEYAYRNRTIFPDVRTGCWARGYINLAVSGEKKIILGGGDGLFRPDDPITIAQAVTILMRMLGYTDSDAGMLWPEGYIALAMGNGLADDIDLTSMATPITRALAAHLFCNLLGTETKGGGTYISKLGTATNGVVIMQLDATTADGTKGAIKTSAGTYATQSGVMPASLLGLRGTLIKNAAGKVLTFLPDRKPFLVVTVSLAGAAWIKDTAGKTHNVLPGCTVYTPDGTKSFSDVFLNIPAGTQATLFYGDDGSVEAVFLSAATPTDAFIVGTDITVDPLRPLIGYDMGYTIYKNGTLVSSADICPYDVATYDKYSKVVQVTDFRLTGCYEKCSPSTSYPTKLTLMGREFNVLPSAVKSLQAFRIGEIMTILLTADLQVAGAVRPGTVANTAIGIVQPGAGPSSATVKLFNGMTFSGDPNLTSDAARLISGELVIVASPGQGQISLSPLMGNTTPGALNVVQKTVGTHPLSPYVRIYERVGRGAVAAITLGDLTQSVVDPQKIVYTELDKNGKVIMLVLNDVTGDRYTYGFLKASGQDGDGNALISVVNGDNPNGTAPVMVGLMKFMHNDVGGLAVTCDGAMAEALASVTMLRNVSKDDFLIQGGVTYIRANGMIIPVAKNVQCYNNTSGTWLTSIDDVRASYDMITVYYDRTPSEGGKIRMVIVG